MSEQDPTAKDQVPVSRPRADFSNVRAGGSSTAPAAPVPEPVPPPPEPVPEPAPTPRIYVVAAGDSLSKIAKREFGDARQWTRIFEANKETVKDPNMIRVGQKLIIPEPEQP